MAHVHHTHRDDDVEFIERDRSFGSGFALALALILIAALIAFAVLWSRPWDSSGSRGTPNTPGISDNGGGSPGQDNSGGGAGQPAQ